MIQKILMAIGISMFLKWTGEALNPAERLDITFDGIRKPSISLTDTTLPVSLKINNQNPYSIAIANLSGVLVAGAIRIPVQRDVMFELTSGQVVNASFNLQVSSGDFFLQLGQLIESKQSPSLRFLGNVSGAIEGKTFSMPIDQQIPLL